MMSATFNCQLPHELRPMSPQAVKFRDGMIITADDLDAAVHYPLAIFQSLVRAYFGCGIVCGLNVSLTPGPQPTCPAPPKQPLSVCINPGVALGCDGYPIELCKAVTLDLTPDPCCDNPTHICIAIRRVTSDERPRRDCGCASGNCGCAKNGGASQTQCTRVKEHVLIQAFDADKLPRSVCALPPPKLQKPNEPVVSRDPCECLKECADCDCFGESWVLLDCVTITSGNQGTKRIQIEAPSRRQYVKPIQCNCQPRREATAGMSVPDATPPQSAGPSPATPPQPPVIAAGNSNTATPQQPPIAT